MAAFVVALCMGAATHAEDDPAKAFIDRPGPSGLTVKDFAAPVQLSMPRLSPSGTKLALVHRLGDQDEILVMNLPETHKAAVIFRTNHMRADLAKKHWRNYVSFMKWKSDTTLLVSISGPVFVGNDYFESPYDLPIHIVLDADGKNKLVPLNQSVRGGSSKVELSQIQNILPDDPDHILLTIDPDLKSIEVDRVDIRTGARETLEKGDENVDSYLTDYRGNIVGRYLLRGDGWLTLQGRAPGKTAWSKIVDIRKKEERQMEEYDIFGLGEVGTLYIGAKPKTPTEGDTEAVHAFDLRTMKPGPAIWSHPTYDVDSIIQNGQTGAILGGCYWADTFHCDFSEPTLSANLKGLNKAFGNKTNLSIAAQARNDSRWVLSASGPTDPGSDYLYDVAAHHVEFLGDRWLKLTDEALAPMRRFEFKARDGTALFAYVTEPRHAPDHLLPLIVVPHGGPEVRDHYDYDDLGQFLASRGYTVLQPNFRGGGGFGRKFAQAGYRQWGGLMHTDVMDATKALVAEGKVNPGRVCIVGGSYGGYEAMYAAATEPETFKCSVAFDGVSDLMGIVKFERVYGTDSPTWAYWRKSEGDPATDSAYMLAHSPYRMAIGWKTPTLLIHGDKDDIVPVEESRQMNRALQAAGKPVRYVEVAGMGHGPSTEEETTKVYSEIALFLATHLDGGAAPAAAAAH